MDRLGARDPRHFQDPILTKIRLTTGRRTNAIRFIRIPNMNRVAIGLAVHSHRANAHFTQCAHHAHGNFAAVGNQNFSEHPTPSLHG
jgi:hypothetical protein